ncbi:MAG: Cleavage polyadenylation factor subunit clp1 [Piccolia ochrophora]|nr:MAG: Cleavage polyadenylation factor subunit clp1 [Piccolia ochrophora]
MSLPGLQLSAPTEVAAPTVQQLDKGSEWRFEVAFGSNVEIKLLTGTAEIFGTELAPKQTYTFTGIKAAVYTWHGCRLEVTGNCQVEYTAEETPMVSYANTHFAIDRLRQEAASVGREGPRVLVVGPDNAGKSTLVKILTGYATKDGRQPIVINLDPRDGLLSVPGSLTATAFSSIIDVEEGWGSSPTSGPSPVPVKLPLVYYYGMPSPEDNPKLFKPITTRLAVAATSRLADDPEAKEAGIIIDTPGIISQGKGSYDIIQHIVSEFSVNVLLVLGSERLYSDMHRRFDSHTTSTDEKTTVVKLAKSGGCVDRDEEYMKLARQAQIREYFFGDAKRTLSPHTQQVDFHQLTVYKIHEESAFLTSLLPGGSSADLHDADHNDGPVQLRLYDKLSPSPAMQNSVLAIMAADPDDSQENIRDAPVLGFVYVADVDEAKRKVRVLAPVAGRLPVKALVWGMWPEVVVNLVG